MKEIFEEMWLAMEEGATHSLFADQASSKRYILGQWRKTFKKHNLTPRRYLAILHLGNGHYACESESRAGVMHSVDISEHGCSCENKQIEAKKRNLPPDYKCKHMRLIDRLIEENILPATVQ